MNLWGRLLGHYIFFFFFFLFIIFFEILSLFSKTTTNFSSFLPLPPTPPPIFFLHPSYISLLLLSLFCLLWSKKLGNQPGGSSYRVNIYFFSFLFFLVPFSSSLIFIISLTFLLTFRSFRSIYQRQQFFFYLSYSAKLSDTFLSIFTGSVSSLPPLPFPPPSSLLPPSPLFPFSFSSPSPSPSPSPSLSPSLPHSTSKRRRIIF